MTCDTPMTTIDMTKHKLFKETFVFNEGRQRVEINCVDKNQNTIHKSVEINVKPGKAKPIDASTPQEKCVRQYRFMDGLDRSLMNQLVEDCLRSTEQTGINPFSKHQPRPVVETQIMEILDLLFQTQQNSFNNERKQMYKQAKMAQFKSLDGSVVNVEREAANLKQLMDEDMAQALVDRSIPSLQISKPFQLETSGKQFTAARIPGHEGEIGGIKINVEQQNCPGFLVINTRSYENKATCGTELQPGSQVVEIETKCITPLGTTVKQSKVEKYSLASVNQSLFSLDQSNCVQPMMSKSKVVHGHPLEGHLFFPIMTLVVIANFFVLMFVCCRKKRQSQQQR